MFVSNEEFYHLFGELLMALIYIVKRPVVFWVYVDLYFDLKRTVSISIVQYWWNITSMQEIKINLKVEFVGKNFLVG